MTNCPNCGAPIEPYKCKCGYCGTWYFDFTAFDMSDDKPYYVKFRTLYGVLTTLAKPEVSTIDVMPEDAYAYTSSGMPVARFAKNTNCDLNVIFHTIADPENKTLFTLEVPSNN